MGTCLVIAIVFLFFKTAGEDISFTMDVECTDGLFRIDKIVHVLTDEIIYEEVSN